MGESPTLLSLCTQSIANDIIYGDDWMQNICELPSDLINHLIMHLPPLALQKLHEALSSEDWGGHDDVIEDVMGGRKRKRFGKMFDELNMAWKALFESRWPEGVRQILEVDSLKYINGVAACEFKVHSGNWQQMYWETHLQNCLDRAAEMALLPSFKGYVGEIAIPGSILNSIGYIQGRGNAFNEYAKLSHHCQQFGRFARCLRLQNVLCAAETCDLLKDSKLQVLLFRSIKSKIHVDAVCKLLHQKRHTLLYLEFIHSRLYLSDLKEFCSSLMTNGDQRHGIRHFLIKSSSILGCYQDSILTRFSFLRPGSLSNSMNFIDNQAGPVFAKMMLDTLIDFSSCLSTLEISECNISGGLSKFKWMFSNCSSPFGVEKSVSSLRALNLRGNHLNEDDIENIKAALFHMPNLQKLDLSDNPIGDGGIRCLLSYIDQFSEKGSPLVDIRIENCGLSCTGVTELLQSLSTTGESFDTLSISENELGCHIAGPLAKILQTSRVKVLNIEDIGLGPSGFLQLGIELPSELELICINISKNRGGIEAANFVSKLIRKAPELVMIKAGYNFMPAESLKVISEAMKLSKGKLERLDLTGNARCHESANESTLAELKFKGNPIIILPSLQACVPYDDDP